MKEKLFIPCLYLLKKKAVVGWGQKNLFGSGDVLELSRFYSDHGADELLIFDFSSTDEEHEEAIGAIKEVCSVSETPVLAAGHINRMEDVKKLLYAGCAKVVLNFSKESNISMLEEVSKRFGKEKLLVSISSLEEFLPHQEAIETYCAGVLALDNLEDSIARVSSVPILLHTDERDAQKVISVLKKENVWGVSGSLASNLETGLIPLKKRCKEQGLPVNTCESRISWAKFKLNSDGLVPVIVQDYKTDEVLMLAYMNRESLEISMAEGRTCFWSRSRQELWRKGETSGNVQHIVDITADCDRDALVVTVDKEGPACHLGTDSCFDGNPIYESEED